jgi:methylated-DNA-[protein]-cysteine S-methyltransferase
MFYTHHESPLGPLLLVADATTLCGLYMDEHRHGPVVQSDWAQDDRPFHDVRLQLDEYFAGARRTFALPLAAQGTAFQRAVWASLVEIPYGATRSYGELASALGKPSASRAVGAANGRNPISIVVPCHRVIGANGALTGYAGGEERKRWLLQHEARWA